MYAILLLSQSASISAAVNVFLFIRDSMKFALTGGFGNVLFQLNAYYFNLFLFDGVLTDSISLRRYRRLRGISAPDATEYLRLLSLQKLIIGTHGLKENSLFLCSKIYGKPVLGHFWSDRCEFDKYPPGTVVRNYGQTSVPVSEIFTEIVIKAIIYPRLSLKSIANSFDAVVHIRGGDYSFGCRLSSRYYLEATREFTNVLVCTNDRAYALLVLPPHLHVIFSADLGASALDDFALMSFAKILIGSNSTFSWWAGECGRDSYILEPRDYLLGSAFLPLSNVFRHKLPA